MTDSNTESSSTEKFTQPSGGPTPTPEEERAAERSADDVDLDQVAEHYEEMNEKGANVEGEGQVS